MPADRSSALASAARRFGVALPFLARHKGRIGSLVLLGTASSFAEGASVALVAAALGTLLGGGPSAPLALSGDRPALLVGVVGALLALRAVASGVYQLLGDTLSARIAHDVRVAVFGGFVGTEYPTTAGRGAGALLNTLEWEVFAIPDAVGALAGIAMDLIATAVYAAFLLASSWRLAGLAVLCGAVLLPLSAVATPRLRRLSEEMRIRFEGLATVHVSAVTALRTIKLFGAEPETTERQRAASARSMGGLLAIARHNVAVRVVRRIAVLVVAAVFLLLVARSGVSHATALTVLALLYRIVPHAQSAEGRITGLLGDAGRLRSTLDALDLARDTERRRAATAAPSVAPRPVAFSRISLRGVRYSYGPSGEPALAGVDLDLERGSFTAITGPSGGGKTTLVNLLARLAVPDRGEILVDGRPLGSIDHDDWLATVAFAGQDVELVRGTVGDNLRMGRPELSDDALWDALGVASAASFVRALDGGLGAEVGDRGRTLSGGQRQRLVLARALARSPALLVLDEATNAVDPEMESLIHRSIRVARPGLTVLSITHRGDTSHADQVVVIDLGRVAAVATEPSRSRREGAR